MVRFNLKVYISIQIYTVLFIYLNLIEFTNKKVLVSRVIKMNADVLIPKFINAIPFMGIPPNTINVRDRNR